MWLKIKNRFRFRLIILALLSVVAAMFQNCGGSPGDVTTSTILKSTEVELPEVVVVNPTEPHPEVKPYVRNIQVNRLSANRMLMTNIFIDVFGPTIVNTASSIVAHKAVDFGSGQSSYDHLSITDCTKKRVPASLCSGEPVDLNAQPNQALNIRREAWRLRVCYEGTQNNTSLNYTLKRVDAAFKNDATIPALTEANLTRAFQLFFRAKPKPDYVILDSLMVVAGESATPRDQWRAVIRTICTSPHWQVL